MKVFKYQNIEQVTSKSVSKWRQTFIVKKRENIIQFEMIFRKMKAKLYYLDHKINK